ncbi:DUF3830 family protein [Cytobacillus oceanisediminis]|uniref:DUF3830 family protein n=1 Tax=Cytobacillus oceanisediminis 2691 TaxID=1196031 RepID=A0A160MDL4_9BACI|nr:DUF3830 family protein [Cytobacillus oceanisediminis]AND40568.1 hypothetical protein A361_15895 [Cytobacillus oceanisediminis 2691]MCM3243091.1 DUF3830 family protein [Cytobacillus oceanisediminis]MCM3401040.1 DUF3830 family protein [Cytobacillus oceanisediminis]MDK7665333.1 DUF3830 family protein [Cytobacillus oceanisediminis]
MKRILITFENGESFPATLKEDKAPQTCEKVWEALPLCSVVRHSRWSGRDLNFAIKSNGLPKRENQTIFTSIGEVVYWRDWPLETDSKVNEVIAMYYGAEHTRSNKGDELVNVFAQIDYTHFELLETVGERIWLNGTEKIKIEKMIENE